MALSDDEKNFHDLFSRFDTVHEWDETTIGRKDGQNRVNVNGTLQ